jgi:hypothetical protein
MSLLAAQLHKDNETNGMRWGNGGIKCLRNVSRPLGYSQKTTRYNNPEDHSHLRQNFKILLQTVQKVKESCQLWFVSWNKKMKQRIMRSRTDRRMKIIGFYVPIAGCHYTSYLQILDLFNISM